MNINAVEKMDNFANGRLEIYADFWEGHCRIVSHEQLNDFKQWLYQSCWVTLGLVVYKKKQHDPIF